MKWLNKLYIFHNRTVKPHVRQLLFWADSYACLMSFVFVLAIVYKHGFRVSTGGWEAVDFIYQWTWISFLVVNTLYLLLNFQEVRRSYRKVTWGLNLLLYLTLLPVFFKSHLPLWLVNVLQHHVFLTILLLLLSFLKLSGSLVHLFGKRTNPSLILASSFLILILTGTGLLMLPKATYGGIAFIDALFTSTSAVCVTGLTTVDVAQVFTPVGQFIILLLIQIGGLGVMTITCFFAMFFMGNTSLYNQLAVKDMVSSRSLNSLLSTLLYILGFTLSIEAIGAFLLYLDISGTMGMTLTDELFFVAFHSVSAFCNAGFSTLSGNLGNELIMSHTGFYVGISLLVILGGIGYPILVNFYQTLLYEVKKLYVTHVKKSRMPRKAHLYDLNTRIVVRMTLLLLSVGTLFILIAEWNGAFAGMSFIDKIVHAFFNAACPRTAGFNSVSLSSMGLHTLLLYMLLMIVGGGTQSTAGGVKVNVFAVVLLNLRSVLTNSKNVTAFQRELTHDSIRRSNATFIFYLIVIFLSFFLITMLEPDLPVMALLFECVSALGTVGSSLDLTPLLGNPAKLLLVMLMFVGRVGILTLVASLMGERKERKYQYPSDQIIIN